VPVREAVGTATKQVCVGSSVNSSFEDLATVAAVLRGRTVHRDLDLTVTPGSRQILDTIVRAGVYSDLVGAGARMLEPACGPCIGMGQAPASGAVSVRTFNRNFPGRSGTPGDRVYLCSPATGAATALRGEIADPRGLGEPPVLEAPPGDPELDDRQFVRPPADWREIELLKGKNIVPPPTPAPVPASIAGRVLIVVPDDVSTGDMAPDGVLGLAIWSNIPACARYMFRRFDPQFKPDWSPELLLSCMYFSNPLVLRRSLFWQAGGVRDGFEGSEDYDLALRATELTHEIGHIPKVIYHARGGSAATPDSGERAIQEALERLIAGRTVFAIAHRLSTLRRASRLFVIRQGRLAESGTHRELLATEDGIYKRLYEMQLQLQ